MIERRVVFHINRFIEDLSLCLSEGKTDMIDETVQRYKDFLNEAEEPILSSTKEYVEKHPSVTRNQEVKSYIMPCHE